MSKCTKICIVGPDPESKYLGGVATHVKNLISLQNFKGATVFDTGSFNSNIKTKFWSILKNIFQLRKKIVSTKYRHVLINTSIGFSSFLKLVLILFLLPADEGMNFHVFFHGGRFKPLNSIYRKIFRVFLSPILKKALKFHFLSQVQMEGFREIFGFDNLSLYANYSPSNSILHNEKITAGGPLDLLFVGRVVREKGVFQALSAVERIISLKYEVRITYVGHGRDLEELRQRSAALPSGVVCFKGFLCGAELETVYKNSDIFVFPTSHPEGFPYVFIESMRSGLPMVATREGALDTIIEDGKNGFHISRDDVESVVDAIMRFVTKKEILYDMSEYCHRYFRDNLSKKSAEKYYRSIISP